MHGARQQDGPRSNIYLKENGICSTQKWITRPSAARPVGFIIGPTSASRGADDDGPANENQHPERQMIFIDPTNAPSTFLKRLLVALFGKSIKATEDKKKKGRAQHSVIVPGDYRHGRLSRHACLNSGTGR